MNEFVRNAVWQAMLDAERFVRYYGARAEHHRNRHRIVRFLLLFAAVGALGDAFALVVLDGQWISKAAGISIVGLVIWDFMVDDGKKATILHAISVECGEYQLSLRSLWLEIEHGEPNNPSGIREELQWIEAAMLRLTARAGYADIEENEQANTRAAEEAYEVVPAQFAIGEHNSG